MHFFESLKNNINVKSSPKMKPNFSAHDSAIMQSIDSPSLLMTGRPSNSIPVSPSAYAPDVLGTQFMSLPFDEDENENDDNSFLLLDDQEKLKVISAEQFIKKLKIPDSKTKLKVVSIFGNTGDGKSHTLNYAFFNGKEIFHTSDDQKSCTYGVWAAYNPKLKVICLDTEGMLGVTNHENQRTRLLLKVLAISDIIIYCTRAERLHTDMCTFLGSASKAFTNHFNQRLQAVAGQQVEPVSNISALGPSVIIFHETRNTKPLQSSLNASSEDTIREYFAQLKLKIDAFSSVRYIGIQTTTPSTSFTELQNAIQTELENTTVRSPRYPHVVFDTLKILNDKFSDEIANTSPLLFPDQYFTCGIRCSVCDSRCEGSMGHLKEGVSHTNNNKCRANYQLQNFKYLCKTCYSNGREVIATLSDQNDSTVTNLIQTVWYGSIATCPNCGEIYQSRKHWYGNPPIEDAVRVEYVHVWPEGKNCLDSKVTGQKLMDGCKVVLNTVASVGSPPAKAVTTWISDKVRPDYWRPDHEVDSCHNCKKPFNQNGEHADESPDGKHHCRACGEIFCNSCSSHSRIVPERNWHTETRVCDACFINSNRETSTDESEVLSRQVSETVVGTLKSVGSLFTIPINYIKDSARPAYWEPDDVKACRVCEKEFGSTRRLHHCRDCGKAVCGDCSKTYKPVPSKDWHSPVRVCDRCVSHD